MIRRASRILLFLRILKIRRRVMAIKNRWKICSKKMEMRRRKRSWERFLGDR